MNIKKVANLVYSILDIKNSIVGVKLIKNIIEYNKIIAIEPKKTINYCGIIKAATNGHQIKVKEENFKCKSGLRVLGINGEDAKNFNGQVWCNLGLYANFQVSSDVRKKLTYYLKEKNFGIYVAPIEVFNDIPDVILVITNSYNGMRIIQGYSYHFGVSENIQIVGNQALCYESTARVLVTKDINVSLLCIGTRHRANWKDEDLCIGIHGEKFEKVVNGILETINPMESDKRKMEIQKKLQENSIENSFIKFNNNYYNKV